LATSYLYQLVYHTLKHRIEEGIYPEGSRIPSTRDLAEEFGTTPVTIDRSLGLLVTENYIRRVAKSGSFVNAREHWRETIDEQTASGLVGAIVFDASVSNYWSQVVADIEEAVTDGGMHLVVGHSQHNPERSIQYVKQLSQKGIEGFIFVPIDMPTEQEYEEVNRSVIAALQATGKPFVLFDRTVTSVPCSSVTIESVEAAATITQTLLDEGAANPICISVDYASVIGDRERAFVDVLRRNGFATPESRIHRLPTARVRDRHLGEIERILACRPDAVFAINSSVTNALLKVVPGEGPRDTPMIVGFEELELRRPGRLLQTVYQPLHDPGQAVGKLIVNLIRGTVDPMWRSATARLTFPCTAGPVRTSGISGAQSARSHAETD
jgi:DNA-binding LacI/PurR family transcriptional regulator